MLDRRMALAALAGSTFTTKFAFARGRKSRQAPDAAGWHVILCSGQSNECAIGMGSWTPLVGSQFDSQIFQLGRFNGNDMQIVSAADPSEHWTPGCYHGATLSRARQYIAQGLLPAGYNLLIVPAACGSTSILHWDKTVGYNVDLWGDLSARLEMGLSLPNATLTWFVWRQVENDLNAAAHCQNKLHPRMPDAATWLAHTEAFLQNFRAQFGNVPISLTQPTDAYLRRAPVKPDFRSDMLQLASDLGNSTVTDTIGLASNYAVTGNPVDEIHFKATSQERIAQRNVADYAALLSAALQSPNKLLPAA